MLTERAIINFLIIAASFILVPFIIFSTLTVDYAPALLFGGVALVAVAFFYLKDKLCFCPVLASGIAGTLNFLPLPLHATHIASVLLILYYITGYIAIKQKPIKLGITRFFWPILVVTLIVLYHNHSLSVHTMGGSSEGAKPAILLFVAVLAYFCGINVNTPGLGFTSRIPLLFLLLVIVSSLPFFLSTFIPGLAPYLYAVTDDVNVEAYSNSLNTNGSGDLANVSRFAAFGPVASALQLYLLCYYPIGTWLRPSRWWIMAVSLGCAYMAVTSGYRNVIFSYMALILVATWCYYSARAILLPVCLATLGLMIVVASENNLIHLPLNKLPLVAQRTLSFLPGDWDTEALESAKSSNDFRENIEDVYIKEYLFISPLIGNGFSIDSEAYDSLNATAKRGTPDPDYTQAKIFITGKMFHTGWLSVYDAVGTIGMLAFVVLGFNVIAAAAHFIIGPKANRRSLLFPLYIWILCNTVVMMVSFFVVFGDFAATFSNLCFYGILLSHLSDLEKSTDVPVPLSERQGQAEFSGLKAGLYGYPSRPRA